MEHNYSDPVLRILSIISKCSDFGGTATVDHSMHLIKYVAETSGESHLKDLCKEIADIWAGKRGPITQASLDFMANLKAVYCVRY